MSMMWSKKEEAILLKIKEKEGCLFIDELIDIMPYRTEDSIRNKVRRMRIPYLQSRMDRNINFDILEELYGLKPSEI